MEVKRLYTVVLSWWWPVGLVLPGYQKRSGIENYATLNKCFKTKENFHSLAVLFCVCVCKYYKLGRIGAFLGLEITAFFSELDYLAQFTKKIRLLQLPNDS